MFPPLSAWTIPPIHCIPGNFRGSFIFAPVAVGFQTRTQQCCENMYYLFLSIHGIDRPDFCEFHNAQILFS